MTEEEKRLAEARIHGADWKHWGPYLSERAWGTVREDYSADGSAWDYFPHDHARSRAYRWNEDGLFGISDRQQLLCFALALWNGKDPILKERLFGLTGNQGNHGEDVKEYYAFLDSTPTHSYMKAVYKYPQGAYPYQQLIEENAKRGRDVSEYELLDTGIFSENRYFDVMIEYGKSTPEDILISVSVTNHGPESAELLLLPTIWFRNTWSWESGTERPKLGRVKKADGAKLGVIEADHSELGKRYLHCQAQNAEEVLFTENDTNHERIFKSKNATPYVKDGIHDFIVHGKTDAVNPEGSGTKASVPYRLVIAAGQTQRVRLRLSDMPLADDALGDSFAKIMDGRIKEADAFYATVAPEGLSDDARNVQRQALAGMLWSKQFYHYDVRKWLNGDPACPPPPDSRWNGRNKDWTHVANDSVMSMPDSWEYPWYAAWDLAFHAIPLALVDADFAKRQLILLLREWYMHPNGQLPAYEWAFGDVNPPVHAWAAMRVYQIDRRIRGERDTEFLERVFHKLLINFTWWVNRKDTEGRNIFQGGFLGLDNIGLFDRSAPLPNGAHLDQSDGTSWMAMYCLNMLAIALELASHNPAYEDVATKFLEHFFYIAHAMNNRPSMINDDGVDLWDDGDGFYYDVLHMSDGTRQFLPVRSMVGLIPLLAVETIDPDVLAKLPDFQRRMEWFLTNRPELCADVASFTKSGLGNRRIFSIVNTDRLRKILTRMLDESEFLSPHGIRSVSRYHKEHPCQLTLDGHTYTVDYEPAESKTPLFGGNSNWRGPVWFPVNYLIIEALQKFDHYYGESFKIEYPTGSGNELTLWEVATRLSQRLIDLFLRDSTGGRPIYGSVEAFQKDPHWRDLISFYEYFHGDTGSGLGASHQTGWTGLIAKLIQQSGVR